MNGVSHWIEKPVDGQWPFEPTELFGHQPNVAEQNVVQSESRCFAGEVEGGRVRIEKGQ